MWRALRATPALLETVERYLDDRRLITTKLRVLGPRYRTITVIVEPVVLPFPREALVVARIRGRLAVLLHPTVGGSDGEGWPFGRSLSVSEVYATVEAVEGVDYVEKVSFVDEDGEELVPRRNAIPLEPDEKFRLKDVRVQVSPRSEA